METMTDTQARADWQRAVNEDGYTGGFHDWLGEHELRSCDTCDRIEDAGTPSGHDDGRCSECDPQTRGSRLDGLIDEYPSINGDGYADTDLTASPKQYALIERNDGAAGGYWISTHDSVQTAMHYNTHQEYAEDWYPLGVLDLDSGEQVSVDREYVAVIDGVPAGAGADPGTLTLTRTERLALLDAIGAYRSVRAENGHDWMRLDYDDRPSPHQLDVLRAVIDPDRNAAETDDGRPLVATLRDGSQVLVNRWSDGSVTVATRPHPSSTWGVPAPAEAVR